MRLAHLTDLHLPIPNAPGLGSLMNKRMLGYISWRRNRQFRHKMEALTRIVEDCRAASPDLTAISGDLINISLREEFSFAAQWLAENFERSDTGYCPGNHDAYVKIPWSDGLGAFAAFMEGRRSDAYRQPLDETDFPFVREVGRIGVVFANSSPPTAPGLATGRLGAEQIERIAAEMASLGARGMCRVLVMHHPLTDEATPIRKALNDRRALRAALEKTGVELVLHGHTHRSVWAEIATKDGLRPVVGGASASHPTAHGKYRPARYNLFSIDGGAEGGWRIEVEVRELDPSSGKVNTAERRCLLPAEQ